ncbi:MULTISPECIES: M57 family metalloprotease [Cellulophaga]|uniref:Dual-action HEIGH metallo-peptidase n=2 Tax=Cellulophaga baltica TaxID=76594 RepID=A0A1G7E7E5_9FLAO|nr:MULTISPECIES: M57 family metalloprotease [Cellulophaga]WFO15892.1 zinc-dependent metalloprotease [Cellulophaga baltica 4]AIY11776.1 peptidase [Cellulophaga baltica NN016038]AIZ40145.1 peptidase [Cellulophaga baltica 18]KGK30164.1 peptidase [Cellulophaga sp. E6(2014)]MBA6314435.1 peptidase [Cellulophaga baltica]
MKKRDLTIIAMLLLVVASSCEKEKENDLQMPEASVENVDQEKLLVTDEVVSVFKNNYYNVDEVSVVDFMLPDGSMEERFQLENDILFSAEQFKSLAEVDIKSAKNYHTSNLVSPRTLTIIGYTGGQNALSSIERTALQYAVNNYNALNLSIRFTLTFGTSYQDKDMVVYLNPNESGAGGSAGFPSNGNPNKFVQIYGLSNYDVNVIEHVITHEIGHSVGFRHTDWFSRQSCGQNTNEGTAGVGAIPVPGTPEAYDPTSIMLACFSSNEDGEFNNNDITALNYLY